MNMVLEPWSVTRSCSSVHGWDDDVSSAVCRERQPWNAMTHLTASAERRQDDQADAPWFALKTQQNVVVWRQIG